MLPRVIVSREFSLLFLVHFDVHKLTLIASLTAWFGEDALERGLCDEIATADDVLLDFVDKGYDVYEVAYDPAPEGVGGLLAGLPRGSGSGSTFSD